MKYLITDGCGFLGSNLALEVLSKGEPKIDKNEGINRMTKCVSMQ